MPPQNLFGYLTEKKSTHSSTLINISVSKVSRIETICEYFDKIVSSLPSVIEITSNNKLQKNSSLLSSTMNQNPIIFLHAGDLLSNNSRNDSKLSYWNEKPGLLLENALSLDYLRKRANNSSNYDDYYPFHASYKYMRWLCNATRGKITQFTMFYGYLFSLWRQIVRNLCFFTAPNVLSQLHM